MYGNRFEFAGIFILKLKIYTVFRVLSICQLHILLSRTAQMSLELHFCVELHTKKSPGITTANDLQSLVVREYMFCCTDVTLVDN